VVKCERLRLDRSGQSLAQCTFEAANFLGPSVRLQCRFKGQRLVGLLPASVETGAALEPGAPVTLSWGEAGGLIFPRADQDAGA
jgi:hypothetical protein